MTIVTLRGHVGVGPRVEGIALVAKDNFSARYDLDRLKGVFCRPGHALVGQSYVDRILVLNTAKGGVATAWMLGEMMSRHLAPKALLFNSVNPILTQGAAFAGLALMDRFETDVTEAVRTGDRLVVNPEHGTVEICRNAELAICPVI